MTDNHTGSSGRFRIRAVVVDDEPASREAVATLLAEVPSVVIVGEAGNGQQAVHVVRELTPDLLFLDIQMPDLDGFGVLEALGRDTPRGVIFITAYDEHALRAFEVHALDYVLKPFGRPRFLAAVSRALERLAEQDALALQQTIARLAADRRADEKPEANSAWQLAERIGTATAPAGTRRIGVRKGTRLVLIEEEDVDWVEAAGDYARLHVGDEAHLVSLRMHVLERRMDSARFLRIHRSVIVNLTRVKELHRETDGGGTVILANGIRLRVARNRWEALQTALGLASSG